MRARVVCVLWNVFTLRANKVDNCRMSFGHQVSAQYFFFLRNGWKMIVFEWMTDFAISLPSSNCLPFKSYPISRDSCTHLPKTNFFVKSEVSLYLIPLKFWILSHLSIWDRERARDSLSEWKRVLLFGASVHLTRLMLCHIATSLSVSVDSTVLFY